MRRRDLLAGVGAAGTAGLTGCLGILGGQSSSTESVLENRPDAVYYPTHFEGMKMPGMVESGGYACSLTYSYPHRFWLVTGTRVKKVTIAEADSVHMMPVVWETETGIVPPDINPQLRVTQDGEQVTQLAPWPMLSQPMGFHFGDNVQLGGEGTYTVEVSIGAPSARRTGALADNDGNESFSFEFTFDEDTMNEITYEDVPDEEQGTQGAVSPMDMEMLPSTTVPAEDALPGDVRGSATSGDASFVVTVLDDAVPFGGSEDQRYLAVSPRTPYNRYVLPLMSLSGTLKRGGSTVFEGPLQATIDPDLRYHYGSVLDSVQSGDTVTLTVDAPPQTARHEGYETAFVEMPSMEVTL